MLCKNEVDVYLKHVQLNLPNVSLKPVYVITQDCNNWRINMLAFLYVDLIIVNILVRLH